MGHGGSIRVLVADDSPIMTRAVVNILDDIEGVDVAGVVFDGQEAVVKAAELSPDLVLLDFRMPKLDGLAAADDIRTSLPGAKVVIMSMHEHDALRRAAEARSDGFIHKAEMRDCLAEKLRQLFPGSLSGPQNG